MMIWERKKEKKKQVMDTLSAMIGVVVCHGDANDRADLDTKKDIERNTKRVVHCGEWNIIDQHFARQSNKILSHQSPLPRTHQVHVDSRITYVHSSAG
jgi:hypothetical protein